MTVVRCSQELLAFERSRRFLRANVGRSVVEGSQGDCTTLDRFDEASYRLRLPVTVLYLDRVVISRLRAGAVALLGLCMVPGGRLLAIIIARVLLLLSLDLLEGSSCPLGVSCALHRRLN